jgi:hypothetical protein
MRQGLGVVWIGFGDTVPNLLRFGVSALLFEGHGLGAGLGAIVFLTGEKGRHDGKRNRECAHG